MPKKYVLILLITFVFFVVINTTIFILSKQRGLPPSTANVSEVSKVVGDAEKTNTRYTTGNLNLRGSGEEGIIRILLKGTKVKILNDSGEWSLVEVIDSQGGQGWVASKYIEEEYRSEPPDMGQCSSDALLCNNKCWSRCPTGQEFRCPSMGNAYCDKPKPSNLASLIEEWEPKMVYINCYFQYSNGIPMGYQNGSGMILWENTEGYIEVITNNHITKFEGKYSPEYCSVKVENNTYRIPLSRMSEDSRGYDLAYLNIDNPTERTKEIANYLFAFCPAKSAKTGQGVVILGYPTIGSQEDITATEGIISGYENYYYITSAKIDKGNSGGTAISIEENCYLGVPTYAMIGEIESMGRILDFQEVLNRKY